MDDLRDYRFYKDDMIHVNETGQRYIIDKFRDAAFSADSNAFLNKWISIKRDLSHRPFSQESADHQRFLRNLLEKLEKEKNEVNVDQEIEMVKAQLI